MAAFEKHLPPDVSIVCCHSLHGPKVDPVNQPLAIIPHRAAEEKTKLVSQILSCFGSKQVVLSAEEHDTITADTQAVTHAAFLSMGTAWQANNQFPWELGRYVGGIENVKINIMLRIYSNKWHVYAGLAILNPSAKKQIRQYAKSVTELFKLMLAGRREELAGRVKAAGEAVFEGRREHGDELLLREEVLDQFRVGKCAKDDESGGRRKNNHLSLLAMVDCWWKLGIVPYDHMICSTPVCLALRRSSAFQGGHFHFGFLHADHVQLYRLWLGATEYLFRNSSLLEEVIDTAMDDITFREDDLEFTFAARVS